MSLSRYETWELDAMLEEIERPNPFLLRTFFPTERMFETEAIEFDVISRGRRLAPFVSPIVAGKPMRREGSRVMQLKPAYIKPTALVRPSESFVRRPGEGYGGTLSPKQRFDQIVMETLSDHEDMLVNRLEWMAAQALVHGSVVIVGEDYPETNVDFGRDASLETTLTLGARWNQVGSTPLTDIENMALQIRKISKGAVATDGVMDGATWAALQKNAQFVELIDKNYRRSLPGQAETSIDASPRTTMNEPVYVGSLNGKIALWVYDSYYQDDNGADQPYLPPGTFLLISRPALEGRQYYGAILDLDAQLRAQRLFSKSDVKFNPSGLELVSQSAPLVAPRRPNASARITVF